jgi:hypothetical protein
MSRLGDRLTAERGDLPPVVPVRPGGILARLRAVPGLREGVMVWLMRAAMLAYMLGVVTAVEAVLLALQRWL